MSEWKKTWCNLCAVTCGLEMEVEDNRIINVRPDPSSPRSNGYCCRKGRTAKYFVEETFSADTNEIAIYWNSPAVFAGAFFNSLEG